MNSIIYRSGKLNRLYMENILLSVYYLILLLIVLSWTNKALVEPPMLLRVSLTLLFIIPFFKYPFLAAPILTLFVSIRLFSVSPFGYLPSDSVFYFILVCIIYAYCIIIGRVSDLRIKNINLIFLACIIFSNLINLNFEYSFLVQLILFIVLEKLLIRKYYLNLIEIVFIIVTFVLSIYALIFANYYFVSKIALQLEIRPINWNDPNYLSGVIAIGVIISFYNLLEKDKHKLLFRILSALSFTMGVITMGMLASRGAIVAVIIPIIFIVFKKINSVKNFLIIVLIGILIFVALSQTGLFALLIKRFNDDTVFTGTGRTVIWERLLDYFLYQTNAIIILFGGGTNYAQIFSKEVFIKSVSPHNNYLQILFDYGLTGLIVFITIITRWIVKGYKDILILSLIFYFCILCFTLVPLMYLPFWFLLLLIEKKCSEIPVYIIKTK